MKEKCECCNVHPPITVVASRLSPYSMAICRSCATAGAEPRWIIEYVIWMSQGRDNVADWIKNYVKLAADGEYFPCTMVQLSDDNIRLRDMAYALYRMADDNGGEK